MEAKSSVQGSSLLGESSRQEQIVVENYDAEEDGSETSCVPETSQSISRTLGAEDTPTTSKNAAEDLEKDGRRKKTFASFFLENQYPNRGISLFKVENQEKVVCIDYEDVTDVIETWGYSLVGYVAGGFPGLEAINKLRGTWKIPHKFSIDKSGCLVFRFDKEEDKEQILEG